MIVCNIIVFILLTISIYCLYTRIEYFDASGPRTVATGASVEEAAAAASEDVVSTKAAADTAAITATASGKLVISTNAAAAAAREMAATKLSFWKNCTPGAGTVPCTADDTSKRKIDSDTAEAASVTAASNAAAAVVADAVSTKASLEASEKAAAAVTVSAAADAAIKVNPLLQARLNQRNNFDAGLGNSAAPTVPALAPVVPAVVPSVAPAVVPLVVPAVAPSVVPVVAPVVTPAVAPSVVPVVAPVVTPAVVSVVAAKTQPLPVDKAVTDMLGKTVQNLQAVASIGSKLDVSGSTDRFYQKAANRDDNLMKANNGKGPINPSSFSYTPQVKFGHKQPSAKIASAYGWSYMPPQYWSVPQKRPPACIPGKNTTATVTPIYDKSVPVDALDWTQVGSILPKFDFTEVHNPDYYYPGWIAGDNNSYPGKNGTNTMKSGEYYNLKKAVPTRPDNKNRFVKGGVVTPARVIGA